MIQRRVLVTDGYWRKSLATVRALAKAGLNVGIGERTPFAPALLSKYAKWRYIYPSVSRKPAEFLKWLIKIIKRDKFEVLLTPEEETELFVAQNKKIINQFIKTPITDYQKISFVRDKFSLLCHAGKLGISCPTTQLIASLRGIKNLTHTEYPLVLKPLIGTGGRGIRYAHNHKELGVFLEEALNRYGKILVQEYIPGNDHYGVSVIFNEKNEMRSAFVHKKIRQYPITGGVSTYAVSVHNPELIALSEKIMKSIGWYGVANIEFKIDSRDGKPKLMEINPRLWGSMHLAIKAGINFPYLLYELALTGDIKPRFDYRCGVKLRWLLQGDMMNFISNIMKGHSIGWKFFKFYEKDMHYAILSARDPFPALGKVLSLIDYLTSKEMKVFHD